MNPKTLFLLGSIILAFGLYVQRRGWRGVGEDLLSVVRRLGALPTRQEAVLLLIHTIVWGLVLGVTAVLAGMAWAWASNPSLTLGAPMLVGGLLLLLGCRQVLYGWQEVLFAL